MLLHQHDDTSRKLPEVDLREFWSSTYRARSNCWMLPRQISMSRGLKFSWGSRKHQWMCWLAETFVLRWIWGVIFLNIQCQVESELDVAVRISTSRGLKFPRTEATRVQAAGRLGLACSLAWYHYSGVDLCHSGNPSPDPDAPRNNWDLATTFLTKYNEVKWSTNFI